MLRAIAVVLQPAPRRAIPSATFRSFAPARGRHRIARDAPPGPACRILGSDRQCWPSRRDARSSSTPTARWASTPVAAPPCERQPGALARHGGSGRQQAHRRLPQPAAKQGRQPIPPERPTVDDAVVPEIGEMRDGRRLRCRDLHSCRARIRGADAVVVIPLSRERLTVRGGVSAGEIVAACAAGDPDPTALRSLRKCSCGAVELPPVVPTRRGFVTGSDGVSGQCPFSAHGLKAAQSLSHAATTLAGVLI